MSQNKHPGIIILAAGKGTRFIQAGGVGNKLMARYPDDRGNLQPLLALSLKHALDSGLPVRVVTRPQSGELLDLLTRYPVSVTGLASPGSADSIAAGVAASSDWDGWIIAPADMAWIAPQDYRQIAAALTEPLSQARMEWQGQPGHPVGFGSGWRSELLALKGDSGARHLLQPQKLIRIAGSGGNLRDADLPAGPE